MAASLIQRFAIACNKLENTFAALLGRRFPPDAYCIAGVPNLPYKTTDDRKSNSFSLKDLLGEGFLWASPRNRRTVEKRWKRKFGYPEYNWKLLVPKANLRVCNTCGHDHEIGILCPHCYDKVRKETEVMQEAIQSELGLNPVEKDVVVVYEGEREEQSEEFWQGKRIIELKKSRPAWFSKNLMQKTTQQPATTTDVKPTELA